MLQKGKYIYCIIDSQEEKDFDVVGIGGRRDRVLSVVFKDIAAVVSDSPVVEYSISKMNTTAHMKVMEMLMNDHTVLPVKFRTIAPGSKNQSPEERIKCEILKERYDELEDLLSRMRDKIELGLKAIWIDMETVFQEIVEENLDIKLLKKRISPENPNQTYWQRIKLGEMVKRALDKKRAKEEEKILETLKSNRCELRTNKIFGDRMITNSAFLVNKSHIKEFDNLIDKLTSTYNGRVRFKYVGPVPPCNFIEIVITLREEGEITHGI